MLPSHFLFLRELTSGKFKLRGLLGLFGLILSLSIGLGSFTPLWSQPSPEASDNKDCSVPADLCEQIKKQAQDDIEAEEKNRVHNQAFYSSTSQLEGKALCTRNCQN